MKAVIALDALENAGHQLRAARGSVDAAMNTCRVEAIKAAVRGVPETVIATKLGVDRNTVRKWLGKL